MPSVARQDIVMKRDHGIPITSSFLDSMPPGVEAIADTNMNRQYVYTAVHQLNVVDPCRTCVHSITEN